MKLIEAEETLTAPTKVNSKTFLTHIKDTFGINLIYYPGCWVDFKSLEGPFECNQVVYVDYNKDFMEDVGEEKIGRNILIVDAEYSSFRNGCFDAVFMQDMHPEPDEFEGIMATLKPGGILIFSTDDCGGDWGMQLQDVEKHPDLAKLTFPLRTSFYTVFQKRCISSNP